MRTVSFYLVHDNHRHGPSQILEPLVERSKKCAVLRKFFMLYLVRVVRSPKTILPRKSNKLQLRVQWALPTATEYLLKLRMRINAAFEANFQFLRSKS